MVKDPAGAVEVFRSAILGALPHGFCGRRGGVSQGIVAGLNVGLGSEDDPAHVAENRRRATAAIAPGAQLVGVYQTHSARCATVTEPWGDNARPDADALVTNRPGLALGIVTADCAPVLLADAEAGVVGAAHAGWKGALGGVTDATVAAMLDLGARADRIAAVVGPCIAQASYEVDEAFQVRFSAVAVANRAWFKPGRTGHFQFDLAGYVVDRLRAVGVVQAESLGLDTYSDEARFYSFRRATHRREPAYGRQISVIALP